jgi:hypothetical protein
MGIQSKLAMFQCLMACDSKTYDITLEDCAKRWVREKTTLMQVHERAMRMSDPVQQDTFFALNTLHYLVFGRMAWERSSDDTTEQSCPYGDDAINFMLTLVKTDRCLCLCYTQYVLAASEEFDHSLVMLCSQPGHVYLTVVQPESVPTKFVPPDAQIYFDTAVNVMDILAVTGDMTYNHREIYSRLDSGFENNYYIDVGTVDPNFKALYTLGMRNGVHVKREILECTDIQSKWGVITGVLRSGFQRRNTQEAGAVRTLVRAVHAVWGLDFGFLADREAQIRESGYPELNAKLSKLDSDIKNIRRETAIESDAFKLEELEEAYRALLFEWGKTNSLRKNLTSGFIAEDMAVVRKLHAISAGSMVPTDIMSITRMPYWTKSNRK